MSVGNLLLVASALSVISDRKRGDNSRNRPRASSSSKADQIRAQSNRIPKVSKGTVFAGKLGTQMSPAAPVVFTGFLFIG